MSVELDRPAAGAAFLGAHGVTPASTPGGRAGFLSDVIVELGYAERAIVDEAVEQSRRAGKMADAILLERGEITEEQLARATAERSGLPYVDLAEFSVDEGAVRLIDGDIARRYRAVPIAFDADGTLILALADPLDALAASDIGVITKSAVRPAVAPESAIAALLATMPTRQPAPLEPLVAALDELGDRHAGDRESGMDDERGARERLERRVRELEAELDRYRAQLGR